MKYTAAISQIRMEFTVLSETLKGRRIPTVAIIRMAPPMKKVLTQDRAHLKSEEEIDLPLKIKAHMMRTKKYARKANRQTSMLSPGVREAAGGYRPYLAQISMTGGIKAKNARFLHRFSEAESYMLTFSFHFAKHPSTNGATSMISE